MTTPVTLPEFLGGRVLFVPPRVVKVALILKKIVGTLLKPFLKTSTLRRGEDDPRSPDAGKPSPLMPAPVHHLVAARGIPPSDKTYLFPAD
jgi:hypothetical protein